ncbi:MAG: hypothetical protein NC548_20100 [Lachnospiraceae bacterium]|nr:hypothetical protein [Lachnospiraceae bacterium]
MAITPGQLRQIKKIIEEHMNVLMELTVGDSKPSEKLLKQLNLPKELTDLITSSYKYGKLNIAQGKNLADMSPAQVTQFIKKLTLNPRQKKSIEYLKAKTQATLDSLTTKIVTGVVNTVLNDQIGMYQAVKQVIPGAIAQHQDRYQVVQQLRDMTGDWERDWHRVAHTEMWDAKVQGEANAIADNESPLSKKGTDTLVFKRPGPMACNKCKQLYLEKDGVTPKVFKLSEMQAYGTNYGLKQADWKPVVGTVHPNCMCPLSVMPNGFHFDSRGQLEMD